MDFYTYHPSRLSNSQISFGDLASKVKDFFLSTILGNVFSAIFTFFFATVGTLLGAMTGALIGQETESGFVRGAAVGAISGAVFSIEVFESSLLLWQSDESGVGCILYLIDVIVSLLSGRLVRERIGPAMLSAVQSQMGAVETSFDEVHNLFDIGGSKGLPEYSVEKIPKIKVTSKNNLDDSGDKVSCSVCLQSHNEYPNTPLASPFSYLHLVLKDVDKLIELRFSTRRNGEEFATMSSHVSPALH
ncbi:hypothetical protein Tco_1057233 [Tanacetum coccineum]|uniref:YMGG-like Gly-zipper domain-containing protein n=1 Tax=Tanacetum coccineum TaxID=301880 RepID=A0ABQ5H506_9ASTR